MTVTSFHDNTADELNAILLDNLEAILESVIFVDPLIFVLARNSPDVDSSLQVVL